MARNSAITLWKRDENRLNDVEDIQRFLSVFPRKNKKNGKWRLRFHLKKNEY